MLWPTERKSLAYAKIRSVFSIYIELSVNTMQISIQLFNIFHCRIEINMNYGMIIILIIINFIIILIIISLSYIDKIIIYFSAK